MIRSPIPLTARVADAFLRHYIDEANEGLSRIYSAMDAATVRNIIGVREHDVDGGRELIEHDGDVVVFGIGTTSMGGIRIVYWDTVLGMHAIDVNCHPIKVGVTQPDEDNPEF